MKLIKYIVLIILLTASVAYTQPGAIHGPYGGGVSVAKDCDVATYYPIGKLCQDSDDGKLYKGTGAAIVEIAAGSSGDVVAATTDITWGDGTGPEVFTFSVTGTDPTITATASKIAIAGTLDLGANNITTTGSLGATGAGKLTKGWFVDLESTNMPSVNGTAIDATFMPIGWISRAGTNNVLTYTGNYSLGLTLSNNTAVTLPTSGTLATTAFKPSDLSIDSQAAGDIIYFNGTNWVRLAADAGKYLKSGASAVSWDTPVGGGTVDISGTPANHYWTSWTDDNTVKGTAITSSKPVCSDASGDPVVCAGTEGVWQVADADLTALAGLTSAANAIPYFTGSGTASVISSSANMVSLLGSADYDTARTNLGLAIGTNVQAYSDILAGIAGVTPANNGIFGYNNSGTLGLYTNHSHDDSAAILYDSTDATKTFQIELGSITTGTKRTMTVPDADFTAVGTTTTQTLTGKTITVSSTEFIPVGWMIDGAAAPDALATVDLGTRQVKARTFAADSSEDLEFFWQAPADIADGDSGTAGFQVKWRPVYVITNATAPASGEGVTFALASCSSGDGDTGNCTVGDDSVVAYADLDGHAQYDVVYGTYTAMTVTDGAAGEAWMMKVYRDHDHASDDYAQVVGLIGIEVKYVKNMTNGY